MIRSLFVFAIIFILAWMVSRFLQTMRGIMPPGKSGNKPRDPLKNRNIIEAEFEEVDEEDDKD